MNSTLPVPRPTRSLIGSQAIDQPSHRVAVSHLGDTEPYLALSPSLPRQTIGHVLLNLLSWVSTLAIFWIFGRGLWLSTHRFALADRPIEMYGIDKVSGYYGPGAWAAWILTVTACCIDLLLERSKSKEIKASIFSGLDLNLITALSYPVIAAFDLLLHLRYDYVKTESLVKIGSLFASYCVVQCGTVVAVLLSGIYLISSTKDTSKRLAVLCCCTSTSLLILALFAFDIKYFDPVCTRIAFSTHFPTAEDAEAFDYCGLARVARRCPLFFLHRQISTMRAELNGSLRAFYRFVVPAGIGISFICWRASFQRGLISLCLELVIGSLLEVSGEVLFFKTVLELFLMDIWIVPPVPRTTASIIDLDQITALVLSGALVLLSTGAVRLAEYKTTITNSTSSVLHFCMEVIMGKASGIVVHGVQPCLTLAKSTWRKLRGA